MKSKIKPKCVEFDNDIQLVKINQSNPDQNIFVNISFSKFSKIKFFLICKVK